MIATATAAQVFAAAAVATRWTRTNLGLTATVKAAGDTWTVTLPPAGHDGTPRQAVITGSDFEGVLDVAATWGQTAAIVDAAMGATRIR